MTVQQPSFIDRARLVRSALHLRISSYTSTLPDLYIHRRPDRLTVSIVSTTGDPTAPVIKAIEGHSQCIFGVIGILPLSCGPVLGVISKSAKVGELSGGSIHRITQVKFISLVPRGVRSNAVDKITTGIRELLENGHFYYALSIDLSRPTQTREWIQRHFAQPDQTSQVAERGARKPSEAQGSVATPFMNRARVHWARADLGFVWNAAITEELRGAGCHVWCPPIINGNIGEGILHQVMIPFYPGDPLPPVLESPSSREAGGKATGSPSARPSGRSGARDAAAPEPTWHAYILPAPLPLSLAIAAHYVFARAAMPELPPEGAKSPFSGRTRARSLLGQSGEAREGAGAQGKDTLLLGSELDLTSSPPDAGKDARRVDDFLGLESILIETPHTQSQPALQAQLLAPEKRAPSTKAFWDPWPAETRFPWAMDWLTHLVDQLSAPPEKGPPESLSDSVHISRKSHASSPDVSASFTGNVVESDDDMPRAEPLITTAVDKLVGEGLSAVESTARAALQWSMFQASGATLGSVEGKDRPSRDPEGTARGSTGSLGAGVVGGGHSVGSLAPCSHGGFRVNGPEWFGALRRPATSWVIYRTLLVSRRAAGHAGLRYLTRGLDLYARSANYSETEQLVQIVDACVAFKPSPRDPESPVKEGRSASVSGGRGEHILCRARLRPSVRYALASFLQVRASVPILWGQRGIKYHPAPVILKNIPLNAHLCALHLLDLTARYGAVVSLNLLRSQEGHLEKPLSDCWKFFHSQAQRIPALQKSIRYSEWDFHGKTKGDLHAVVEPIESLFPFHRQHNMFVRAGVPCLSPVLSIQSGVVRSNCLDCLDRTNFMQTEFALSVLPVMFASLGRILDRFPSAAGFPRRWAPAAGSQPSGGLLPDLEGASTAKPSTMDMTYVPDLLGPGPDPSGVHTWPRGPLSRWVSIAQPRRPSVPVVAVTQTRLGAGPTRPAGDLGESYRFVEVPIPAPSPLLLGPKSMDAGTQDTAGGPGTGADVLGQPDEVRSQPAAASSGEVPGTSLLNLELWWRRVMPTAEGRKWCLRLQNTFASVVPSDPGSYATLDPMAPILRTLRRVWPDNGDAMSFMYTGTGAIKGDFVRTGTRHLQGFVSDGRRSVTRYLIGLKESERQNLYDVLLGLGRPASPHWLFRVTGRGQARGWQGGSPPQTGGLVSLSDSRPSPALSWRAQDAAYALALNNLLQGDAAGTILTRVAGKPLTWNAFWDMPVRGRDSKVAPSKRLASLLVVPGKDGEGSGLTGRDSPLLLDLAPPPTQDPAAGPAQPSAPVPVPGAPSGSAPDPNLSSSTGSGRFGLLSGMPGLVSWARAPARTSRPGPTSPTGTSDQPPAGSLPDSSAREKEPQRQSRSKLVPGRWWLPGVGQGTVTLPTLGSPESAWPVLVLPRLISSHIAECSAFSLHRRPIWPLHSFWVFDRAGQPWSEAIMGRMTTTTLTPEVLQTTPPVALDVTPEILHPILEEVRDPTTTGSASGPVAGDRAGLSPQAPSKARLPCVSKRTLLLYHKTVFKDMRLSLPPVATDQLGSSPPHEPDTTTDPESEAARGTEVRQLIARLIEESINASPCIANLVTLFFVGLVEPGKSDQLCVLVLTTQHLFLWLCPRPGRPPRLLGRISLYAVSRLQVGTYGQPTPDHVTPPALKISARGLAGHSPKTKVVYPFDCDTKPARVFVLLKDHDRLFPGLTDIESTGRGIILPSGRISRQRLAEPEYSELTGLITLGPIEVWAHYILIAQRLCNNQRPLLSPPLYSSSAQRQEPKAQQNIFLPPVVLALSVRFKRGVITSPGLTAQPGAAPLLGGIITRFFK